MYLIKDFGTPKISKLQSEIQNPPAWLGGMPKTRGPYITSALWDIIWPPDRLSRLHSSWSHVLRPWDIIYGRSLTIFSELEEYEYKYQTNDDEEEVKQEAVEAVAAADAEEEEEDEESEYEDFAGENEW